MSNDAYLRVLDAFRDYGCTVIEQGDRASVQAPGHSPADRSVSVMRSRDRALVYSHSDDTDTVLDTVGLTMRDLFDNPRGVEYAYPDGRRVHRTPDKRFRQSGNTQGTALYRSDQLPADTTATVYVTEGEQDADAIAAVGGHAVSVAQGAGKAHKADWTPLRGRPVVVVADRDEPGRRHAQQVKDSLDGIASRVRIVEAADGKDAADHLTYGHGLDDLVDTTPQPAGPRAWLATDLHPAAPLRWLAKGRIPANAVSLLVGDEGIGKSLFWVWLVAAITNGKPLPEIGLPARDPATVALVITEDDWSSTVLPRLIVAGADITKLIVICEEPDGTGSPYFPNHLGVLEDAVREHRPALVVVDAWLDTVPSGINVKDPHGARTVLHPWKELATRYSVAALLLTHTNRVATGNARDKYGITGELRKKARNTLFAQRDEETGELLIGPEKSNLAGDLPATKFGIEAVQHFPADDTSDGMVPRLLCRGEHEHTARQIIVSQHDDASGDSEDDRHEIDKILQDTLIEAGGFAAAADVLKVTRAAGLSDNSVKKRRRKAGIDTKKIDGAWFWSYDSDTPPRQGVKRLSNTEQDSTKIPPPSVQPNTWNLDIFPGTLGYEQDSTPEQDSQDSQDSTPTRDTPTGESSLESSSTPIGVWRVSGHPIGGGAP